MPEPLRPQADSAILVLIFIAAQPSIALFLPGLAYVISGPLTTLRFYRSMKHTKAEVRENGECGSDTLCSLIELYELLSGNSRNKAKRGLVGVWAYAYRRKIMRKHNQRPRVTDKDQTGRQDTRLREHLSSGAAQVQWMWICCRCQGYGKDSGSMHKPIPPPGI